MIGGEPEARPNVKPFRLMVVPLCAALCAAVFAHVGIDLAGDVLLPHDTFDDVAHGSRLMLGSAAVLLMFAVLGVALRGAIREARGREAAFCDALRALSPGDPGRFSAAVLGLTFVLLLAMQAIDNAVAGVDCDDLASLMGGSLLLGFACTMVAGVAASAFAWILFRWFVSFRDVLVAVAVALVSGRVQVRLATRLRRAVARRTSFWDTLTGCCRTGRAPPRPASVRLPFFA